MSIEKITKSQDKCLFLGLNIYVPFSRNHNQKTIYKQYSNRIVKSRIAANNINLMIPIQMIIEKLENQSICRIEDYNKGLIIPTGKAAWISLPITEIIIRYNYLVHSCAKTIAKKMNMNSRAAVFKKYGNPIKVKTEDGKKTISLKIKKSFAYPSRFNINQKDPFDIMYYQLRSISNIDKTCTVCGATDNIEMHHIKSLKAQIKGFKDIDKAMKRKQIAVCRSCHENFHKGIYDGAVCSESCTYGSRREILLSLWEMVSYLTMIKDVSKILENNPNSYDVSKKEGSYLAGLIEGDGTIIVPTIMNRQP
ncbi:hypothetical protein HDU92_008498 [Lobulomyces angularis]|nr:hypothetical protein HDU92_008498 [Lobulomyces angularis]